MFPAQLWVGILSNSKLVADYVELLLELIMNFFYRFYWTLGEQPDFLQYFGQCHLGKLV